MKPDHDPELRRILAMDPRCRRLGVFGERVELREGQECDCILCGLRKARLSAGLTQPAAAQRLVAAGLSRDASGRRLRGWESGSFARLPPAMQAAVLAALKGDDA